MAKERRRSKRQKDLLAPELLSRLVAWIKTDELVNTHDLCMSGPHT